MISGREFSIGGKLSRWSQSTLCSTAVGTGSLWADRRAVAVHSSTDQRFSVTRTQKQVIVTPLLKKAGVDSADIANYRRVSNLTFLSKTVERVNIVAKQLNGYLAANGLLPRLQSAYRRGHFN